MGTLPMHLFDMASHFELVCGKRNSKNARVFSGMSSFKSSEISPLAIHYHLLTLL